MNTRFIEGHLHLKNDGYWYIDSQKIKEGTVFEIYIEDEWLLLSMECSQGAYYSYPHNLIEENKKARIEVDL